MLEVLGRFKERKPDPSITHDAFGMKDHIGRLWLGVYQSPRTGVRVVKHEDGKVRKFETEAEAELAASRQLHKDIDKLPPLKVTKEIVIGRSTKASRRATC
jgi:hypothetical protein